MDGKEGKDWKWQSEFKATSSVFAAARSKLLAKIPRFKQHPTSSRIDLTCFDDREL